MNNSIPPYADSAPVRGITRPWRFFGRWLLALVFIVNLAFPLGGWHISGLGSTSRTAQAASPDVVISQVFGGGGNGSGATAAYYKNDFIELFNRGTAQVDLNGWSVQYNSAVGTGAWFVTPLTGIIQPGHYFLIQESAGANSAANSLPSPDISPTVSSNVLIMSATNGKVALVNNSTAISSTNNSCANVSCSDNPSVRDLVGYGSATNYEGTAAPVLTNTVSARRQGNGCQDTDNNSSDFTTATSDNNNPPRNSQTTAIVCSGNQSPTITPPANPITTVVQNAPPFSVSLSGTDDGSVYNWSGQPGTGIASLSVLGAANTASVSYSVTVQSGFSGTAFFTATLSDGVNPSVNQRVNIQVGAGVNPTTPIPTIQGASQTSPYVGQTVTTSGVVIGTKSKASAGNSNGAPNGYFVQDPTGDGDPTTSDGIFVFIGLSTAPNTALLNHLVQVSGRVQEFASGSSLPFTEIGGGPTITDMGVYTGTAITPVIITADPAKSGSNVRRVPSTTVVSSTTGYNPSVNAIDFYESLESMLVQVDAGLVVGPTNAYGETVVLPDNGAGATGLNARNTIYLTPTDVNPERVMIASDLDGVGRANAPVANVGDKLTRSVIGPLDYNFSNYKIDVTQVITGSDLDRTSEVTQDTLTPLTDSNQLRVISFNIENFIQKPNDPKDIARRNLIAKDIAQNLQSPDLLVINEIQDNTGSTDDGTVNSDQQLNNLVAAITAQGGAAYSYRYVVPNNDTDGGEPGGNIRQVFLFRTDRGLSFVDKPGATANTDNAVNSDGSLLYSPGRIKPGDSAFNSSRKPLAGEFLFQGKRLIVIGNHLNSKGGDDAIFGKNQPPILSSETQRRAQATIIRDFVTQLQTANPAAYIIVAGDMNDFQWSNPLKILKDGNGAITDSNKKLVDIVEDARLTGERYSYDYEGNAQVLDHILYSQSLSATLSSIQMVHLNSEFANADPRRGTDHDPPMAVFNLGSGTPGCASPYLVTQTVDSGQCGSLTYAIQQATADPSSTTILFGNGVKVITLTNGLPTLAPTGGKTISIVGSSTGSSVCASAVITPGVTLIGQGVSVGVSLTGNSTISGLALKGFGTYGVVVTGSNNAITCSWIGTSDGQTTGGGNGSGGVRLGIAGSTSSAAISTTLTNNLISNNGGPGVLVENGSNNSLIGNLIGYSSTGDGLRNVGPALRVLPGAQVKTGPGNRLRN